MRKPHLEKSEMSAVDFCQYALRERIAPRTMGSVKTRILHAARKTGWGYSRTRDVWYADRRVSIDADQLIHIEAISGLEYARREVRTNDEIIARADALLHGSDPDFNGSFVTALRAFAGVFYRSRASGE
jgi:hypothetical protein